MSTLLKSPHRTDHLDSSRVPSTDGVERFSSTGDVLKFAAVVAVLAMLADAVIGHALLWQNDPYWTYWVTDTLLITTVFSIGTALVGASVIRGAVITVVQMLVLTTYYWSLSPIGLPAAPEWLDLQHTWVTGPPVHFGVYYLGYLVTLWLWRRRGSAQRDTLAPGARAGAQTDAVSALITASATVVLVGVAQTIALGEFPGVTWFVMRTVILVPFTLGWWALAGRDRGAAVVGGGVAAVLLAAYGHYLGPVGLPNPDLRIIAQAPPPAEVHWLSYTEEFLVMGPITVVIAVAMFLIASLWHGQRWTQMRFRPTIAMATLAAVGLTALAGFVTAAAVGRSDRMVTVVAAGDASVETGPPFEGQLVGAEADMHFDATQNNTKRTPLPPHDAVDLDAAVVHPDGTRVEIDATAALVNQPVGRFTTWGGVGFDRWHHGRSGVGTSGLDDTRSEVAVYALGTVRADGHTVATGVPVHAMTTTTGGVELHVGDSTAPVPALPGGHLRVVWDGREGASPESPERARHLLGAVVLVILNATALAGARSLGRHAPSIS